MEINYSAFTTLKEQLEDYEVLNLDLLEKLKTQIISLYLHNILTERQKDIAFNKLHKQVMENIKGLKKR